MKKQAAERLLSLNRQFYQTFGSEFSSTRGRLQPGVKAILQRLGGDEAILDLGCGNGGVARELRRRGHRGQYVGVDFSVPLLQAARRGPDVETIHFIEADLLTEAWEEKVAAARQEWNADGADSEGFSRIKTGGWFDWVTCFAVLHHIPGSEARLDILKKAHALLRAGGRFIHSEWQFLNSERLKNRVQSWETAGLTPAAVDPGDYLLDWRNGGTGLRYVHHFDEDELSKLAEASHFRILETFLSDGANGRLGLYQVWEAV